MVIKTTNEDEDGSDNKHSSNSDDQLDDQHPQYSLLASQDSTANSAITTDERTNYVSSTTDDEDYCERQPLIASQRPSKKAFAPLNKHHAISRTVSVSEASTFSILTLSRTQKVVMVTTSLVDFLAFLSVSVMAPFFPEEALKKGVSDTLSGWIFGVAPFVQFLVSPLVGKMIPFVGVKFMFTAGLFTFGGCTLLFGFLSYVPVTNGNGVFIALALLLQVFKSLGVACTSTASFVLMMQEFPDNVATVFGISEVFVGLGMVLGPAVGGILYGLDGFYLPFVSIGGLALLNIPFMLWAVPSVSTAEINNGNENLPIRKIVCSPFGILISASIISSTVMWSILDPTLEPHLRQYNLTPELIGVIFLVMALAYALSAPIWGWLSDKLEDQRILLIFGFLAASVGSLLIGPSPLVGFAIDFSELWLVVLALVILGASASLSSVPTFDMYFTLAEDLGYEDDTRTYSMVAGLWMSMYSLGDFLGPTIGGVLLDMVGFNIMCTYTAGLCFFMACVIFLHRLCDSSCCRRSSPPIKEDNSVTHKINETYSSFADHPCYGSSGNSSVMG